ncbi:MAG: hypothetical protein ACUVUE_01510 [Candidatus Bathycorpusculaceae bacterium]
MESAKYTKTRKRRPTGVTVIAILEVLRGISGLAAGHIVISIFATMCGAVGGVTGRVPSGFGILGGFFVVVGGFIGASLFIVGIADFFIAYGLLKGSFWAWILCLVFAVIGIAFGIVLLPIGIFSVMADAVIVYCLTRPRIKEFFGKDTSRSSPSNMHGE